MNYFVTVIADEQTFGSKVLLAWDNDGRAWRCHWDSHNFCYDDWERDPKHDCPQEAK